MMSAPEAAYVGPTEAPRVGADLRAARQRLGWELPEMAAGLRIRLPYLEALEDGRIADLPGNAYALGFLRTYGAALGLDPDELARRFKAEAAAVNRKTELAFPAPVPERGVPAGAVVLLGAILAIGAYVGWYRLSGEGRLPAETVPPVPARLAPLAEQAVPPSAPAAATGRPAAGPAAPGTAATGAAPNGASPAAEPPSTAFAGGSAGTAAGTVNPIPAAPPLSPSSAAAALPPPGTMQGVAVPQQPAGAAGAAGKDSSAVAAAAASAATAAVPPPPDGSRIVLRAKSDAWMQVRDRAGQVLLNRVLHPGDTWPVPMRANLLLTTGNAGGTELLVDGVATPGLGAQGAVRRDLPLNADDIKDGKLAAASRSGTASGGTAATHPVP